MSNTCSCRSLPACCRAATSLHRNCRGQHTRAAGVGQTYDMPAQLPQPAGLLEGCCLTAQGLQTPANNSSTRAAAGFAQIFDMPAQLPQPNACWRAATSLHRDCRQQQTTAGHTQRHLLVRHLRCQHSCRKLPACCEAAISQQRLKEEEKKNERIRPAAFYTYRKLN